MRCSSFRQAAVGAAWKSIPQLRVSLIASLRSFKLVAYAMAPLWDNHDDTSDVLPQQEVCLAGNIVKELEKRLFCLVRIQRAARLSQLARRHMLDMTEYCRFLPDDDVELVCLRFVWIVQEPSRCNHCCLESPGLWFALCVLLLPSSSRELKSRLSGFPGPAPPRTLQNMTAREASNWTMRLVPSIFIWPFSFVWPNLGDIDSKPFSCRILSPPSGWVSGNSLRNTQTPSSWTSTVPSKLSKVGRVSLQLTFGRLWNAFKLSVQSLELL